MAAAIRPCLGFQVFSFVVGINAVSIQKRKAFTYYRDRDLCFKLNVAPCLAVHDWPDMSLAEVDDVVKNVLLTDHCPTTIWLKGINLIDTEHLLIDWSCGSASMAAVVIVISSCSRADCIQTMPHDSFIAVIHHRFRQPFREHTIIDRSNGAEY